MQTGGHEQEGVIKYHLDFTRRSVEQPGFFKALASLNEARSALKARSLIGQDPSRYGGDGFGNISLRFVGQQFLISGSQTGQLERLTSSDIALVEDFNYAANQLKASGMTKPSSESMTHGVAYQSLAKINAVVHVHSPDIWCHSDCLGLSATAADIPYGTPQMAEAVRQLLLAECRRDSISSQSALPAIVFVMKGHEDGVVAVGDTLEDCKQALLVCLSRAQAI